MLSNSIIGFFFHLWDHVAKLPHLRCFVCGFLGFWLFNFGTVWKSVIRCFKETSIDAYFCQDPAGWKWIYCQVFYVDFRLSIEEPQSWPDLLSLILFEFVVETTCMSNDAFVHPKYCLYLWDQVNRYCIWLLGQIEWICQHTCLF